MDAALYWCEERFLQSDELTTPVDMSLEFEDALQDLDPARLSGFIHTYIYVVIIRMFNLLSLLIYTCSLCACLWRRYAESQAAQEDMPECWCEKTDSSTIAHTHKHTHAKSSYTKLYDVICDLAHTSREVSVALASYFTRRDVKKREYIWW